ncbi:uncharacterized protein LOC133518956 [Cydia pomonella]|uniref:uncharacterized protein LOC133518956 n=1 Tax=Cydia pomonella TaxID=82600 RepID=UPI002ADD66AE|nr:uncharacterized protein LOC133518956 [Cydia pomonella]
MSLYNVSRSYSVTMQEESEKLIFSKTQKGRDSLLLGVHRYTLGVHNPSGSTLWKCINRLSCGSSITLNASRTKIVRKSAHTCEPSSSKNKNHLAYQKCRKMVCESYESVQKIFEDVYSRDMDTDEDSDDCTIPLFENKKRSLYRARKEFLQVKSTSFKTLQDVEVPIILRQNFLIWEDGNDDKILLFGTKYSRKVLKNKSDDTIFFGDGTFKITPQPFEQLFTIHMDVNSTEEQTNIIPMLYALLPDKTTNTYLRLFNYLRNELGMCVKKYKTDYERAAINAFKEVYPECDVSGCFFHYNKAIWRKSEELKLEDTKDGRKLAELASYLPAGKNTSRSNITRVG